MSDLIDSLSRNLRGYWCPMLQYGGLTLRDQTRFKNHGTLTSMDVSNDWVMSRVRQRSGRVLDFDGTNDYVALANAFSIASAVNSKTSSMACWFKTGSTNNTNFPFSLGSTSSDFPIFGFRFQSTGAIEGLMRDNASNLSLAQGSRVLSDNAWHLACIVIDGSNMRVFVDGVLYAGPSSLSTIGTTTVNTGAIGALKRTGLAAYFSGQVAESALFSKPLTLSEIQSLYRLGPGWYQPQLPRRIPYSEQQAGFKAYWARQQSQIIGGGVR